MFGSIGNLTSLIKQARQLEGRLAGVGEELRAKRATGVAGGGLVELEVNGLEEVLRCKIDPSLVSAGDLELLEDLVCAAANQAIAKAKQLHAEAMRNLAGGFGVPGVDEALASISRGHPPAGPLPDGEEDAEG
ncbi:MAG TPA: YbaB/EbfC family nucleoid-associated protein [Pirellulales bacterium]|nr:YbaB/EbfC family nucleoid-associated protein [Pirellulales bacterium]